MIGSRDDWAWTDCESVLVDYDLTLQAPLHLHTAGLGDVLCEASGIAEWRRLQRRAGQAFPAEPALAALEAFHAHIVAGFPQTLDAHGALTSASIRFIMETLQQRDSYRVRLDTAPNVDHLLLFTLEEIHDKSWIHGEIVALAALIITWFCEENPDALAVALDRCRIRRRPSAVALSRDELRRGLLALAAGLAKRTDAPESNSVMRDVDLIHDRFDALWDYLETA